MLSPATATGLPWESNACWCSTNPFGTSTVRVLVVVAELMYSVESPAGPVTATVEINGWISSASTEAAPSVVPTTAAAPAGRGRWSENGKSFPGASVIPWAPAPPLGVLPSWVVPAVQTVLPDGATLWFTIGYTFRAWSDGGTGMVRLPPAFSAT